MRPSFAILGDGQPMGRVLLPRAGAYGMDTRDIPLQRSAVQVLRLPHPYRPLGPKTLYTQVLRAGVSVLSLVRREVPQVFPAAGRAWS